jgi:hypothetical protein
MSLGLAPKSVVAIAPAALVSGYGNPEIETGKEAALHFEDSSPADIVNGGGTMAAPTRSLFQNNLIGIRVHARCAPGRPHWAARRSSRP